MFARANFVQNSLSKVGKVAEKTDKELLDEIREEGKQGIPPVTDEFGEGYFGKKYAHYAVSYTHLTLPTILLV